MFAGSIVTLISFISYIFCGERKISDSKTVFMIP